VAIDPSIQPFVIHSPVATAAEVLTFSVTFAASVRTGVGSISLNVHFAIASNEFVKLQKSQQLILRKHFALQDLIDLYPDLTLLQLLGHLRPQL